MIVCVLLCMRKTVKQMAHTEEKENTQQYIYIYIETVTTTAPAQAKAVEGMEKNCIAHNLKEHKRHF